MSTKTVTDGPRIVVYEDSAPLIELHLKQRVPGGSTISYDLTGVDELEFIVKADPDTATVAFSYKLSLSEVVIVDPGDGPDDEFSIVTVQFSASHLDEPGNLYWHLKATKGAAPNIIRDGILEIKNV